MKFKFINESYLIEDIESVKRMYSNISNEDFMKYIQLDPTYQRGSNNVGIYARWILDLVKRGKFDNEGHIRDILTRFNDVKKDLINKDIMRYKTIDELEKMLNDENSYKEKSHRQEVRDRQRDRKNSDLTKEAELVYEDSNWEVWIPKTYAASCKLGQGTSWCTASTESDYYYNMYKNDFGGEYYININKQNPDEKYQFHFESQQFMDEDDTEIDLKSFLSSNSGLKSFYEPIQRQAILRLLKEFGIDIDSDEINIKISPKDIESDIFDDYTNGFIIDVFNGFVENSGYFSESSVWNALTDETITRIEKYLATNNITNEDDEEFVIDSEYDLFSALEMDDELDGIIHDAYWDAESSGTAENVFNEIISSIEDSLPMKCEVDFDGEFVNITVSVQDLIDNFEEFDFSAYEKISEVFVDYLARYASLDEPYYGWWDFDEDVFNEYIKEQI